MAAAAEDRLRMCENVEEVTHQQLRIFPLRRNDDDDDEGLVPTGERAQEKKYFFLNS